MNPIYRVIWSRARRAWVVASERASPRRNGGSAGSVAVDSVPDRAAWVRRSLCAGLLGAVWAAGGPAVADDLYWDANETGVGLGGTGTWDPANSFWDSAGDGVTGPYVNWDNFALDDAIFTGTAGTVTLAGPVTVHDLSFLVHNYVLNGSTLTLGGATPTIHTPGNTTIGSVIAGLSGLTKTGGGALRLNGINTFSGGIALDNGSLYAASDAALGALSNDITTAAGAAVRLSILGAVDTNRSVTIGDGGLLILEGARAGSALVTGNGNLRVGTNSVTMSNDANTYTGTTTFWGCNGVCEAYFTSIADLGQQSSLGAPTTVENGTILFYQSSQYSDSLIYIGTGHSSNRNWTLAGQAAVLRNRGSGKLTLTGDIATTAGAVFSAEDADFDLLGEISGTANLSFFGDAGRIITLAGSNSYSGTTFISGVTVAAPVLADGGMNSSFGVGATITLNDLAAVSYTGAGGSSDRTWTSEGGTAIRNDGTGGLTLSGPLTFQAGGAADVLTLGGSYSGESTFSGAIDGAGDLVSDGSGTWVLDGANTRSGTIQVDSGTLRAGNADAFGVTTDVTVNGGTLDLNDIGFEFQSLAGSGGTLSLGSATLTLNGAAGSTSYAGGISGTGALTKLGLSTQALSGTNTYTGATTVGGGTLSLDFAAASGPVSDIVSGVSTLNMAGGHLTVIGAAGENNTQTFNGMNITSGTSGISASSGTGGSLTIHLGAINRTGGLIDFVLPSSGNITTSSLTLGGWATVDNGSNYAKIVGGNITPFEESDYTVQDDPSQWQAGEIITDSAGFTTNAVAGGGTLQLGGLRYTVPQATTLNIASGTTLGIDGNILVAPSVAGFAQTITGGSLTGPLGGGTLGIQQNSSGVFTIDSQIVDNGSDAVGFTKSGTGELVLSNAGNTYTGPTVISRGTLTVSDIANGNAPSSLGASSADSSNLVIEAGTLSYTGVSATTDRGFTIVRGGATPSTIAVADAGANLTFTGLVTSSGDADLTKAGPGMLTLANGANDYSGVTTVSGGTLSVTTLADGGQVSSIGLSSNASSNLVLSDGGALQYSGGSAATDRGFTVVGGGGGGGAIDVSQASTTLEFGGAVVDAGAFRKEGTGTLVLSGINTYTGATILNGGTLRAGSTQAFGIGSAITLADAAGVTLDLDGFDNKVAALSGGGASGGNVLLGDATLTIGGQNGLFSGVISGTGGIVKENSSLQGMSGCNNTYTGPTTIAGGTLRVDCLADGGDASGIGASASDPSNLVIGGTLDYTGGSVSIDRGFQAASGAINVSNGGTTLEFSGPVTGARLVKTGPGTLVLSGNNTYGNITFVSGGTLRAGSSTAFGSSGIRMDTAGATLDLDGFDNAVVYLHEHPNISGDSTRTVTLGGATLTITGNGGIYSGVISGAGNLVKSVSGTQTLTGCDNSYTGTTRVTGGALAVSCLGDGGVDSSIGNSSSDPGNIYIDNATFTYIGVGNTTDRRFTVGANGATLAASGTGALEFTSTAPLTLEGTGAHLLTLGGSSTQDNVLAALIEDAASGATRLSKLDDGTWVLTNPGSTYTGVTSIGGGVLSVSKLADGGLTSSIGASSSDAANLVIGDGSTLRYTGSGDTTDRLFTLEQGVTFIESSGTGALQFTSTESATLAGSDARTIALGGTNTGLNIMGGTIADASASGATTLAKNDGGTWVLTGDNTYTGNTVINDGNLIVGNAGTTGNVGAGNVIVDAATSTLSFNRSDTVDFNGTLSGPGSLAQIGAGTTRLTSLGNSIGATTVGAGTLEVSGELASATIAMNGTSTLNVDGTVEGAGGAAAFFTGDGGASTVNVDETGTLTASGELGGGSDIVNVTGTIDAGAAGFSLGDGDDVLTVNDGAVIGGTGGIAAAGGANDRLILNNALALTFDVGNTAGFEQLTKQNSGTVTMTGSQSFSAGTTIDGGTLAVDGLLETPTITLADDTTLAIDGTVQAAGPTQTVITGTAGVNTVRVNNGATLRANGDLGDGNDVLDVVGTLDAGAGTFGLGGGDDVFVVHDGTNVVGTVDAGAGIDTRLFDIDLTADVGVLAGFEALAKAGTGTLNLNGPGSSTLAEVDVQGGTLNVGVGGGIDGAQSTTVASGATLNVDGSYAGTAGDDAFTVGGTVAGSGSVDLGGGDDVLTLEDGVVLNAAIDGGGATTGDSLVLDNTAPLTLDGTSVGGFEALTKQNTGTATLTGFHGGYDSTNVDAGILDVDGTLETGTLALADDAILNVDGTVQAAGAAPTSINGTAGINTVVVTSGGTLLASGDLGDGNDVLDLAGTLDTGAGVFSLGNGNDEFVVHDTTSVTGTLDAGDGDDLLNVNVSLSQQVELGSTTGFESLGKSGLGALEINGASDFVDVQVQAGLLDVTATGGIEAHTATVSADATLNVDGTFEFTAGGDAFTVAGTVTGAGSIDMLDGDDVLTLQDGAVLSAATDGGAGAGDDTVVLDNAADLDFDGTNVAGFEQLVKQNIGTATLIGANGYDTTAIDAGTLAVDGTLETATVLLDDDAALIVGGTMSAPGATATAITGTSGTNTVAVNAGGTLIGAGDLGDGDDVLDVTGTLDTGGNLLHLGAGDDTFVVHDHTVIAGTVDGGDGIDTRVYDIELVADIGALTDFEGLTKTGAGVLSIHGPDTSDLADVDVQGGTLDLQAGAAIENVTSAAVAAGTTLNVDGDIGFTNGTDVFTVAGAVTGAGSIDLLDGDDHFVVTDGADLSQLENAINGGLGLDTLTADIATTATLGGATEFETLIKQGAGTFGITGPAESMFDTVLVEAGELEVAADAIVDPQTTVVDAPATLTVEGSYLGTADADTFRLAGTLAGAGTIDLLDAADVLTIETGADIAFTGLFDAAAGTDDFVLAGDAGSDTLDMGLVGTVFENFEAFRKEGSGTWRLSGTGARDWTVAAGTLIGNSNSFGGDIANEGTVVFDQAFDGEFDGVLAGGGSLIKDNVGTLTVTSVNTFSGETEIAAGVLQVDGVLAGALSVAPGATLSGIGTVGSVTAPADARVVPGNPMNPFGTLTIAGDYTGGGTVMLNTVLGDDSSETSRLVVEGNTAGTSAIVVTNASGTGAQTTGDGIELVQVDGSSPADSFQLGQPVQAGAYEYLLYQGSTSDDNDWYLRSDLIGGEPPVDPTDPDDPPPAYRPGVAGYTLGHQLDLELGFTALGSLRARVGDQGRAFDVEQGRPADAWMRAYAHGLDVEGSRFDANDVQMTMLQFGTDIHSTDTGRVGTHLGVMVSVIESGATFVDPEREIVGLEENTGAVETDVKGGGVYWTRYAENGAYVDLSAQYLHYSSRYRDQYQVAGRQDGWGSTVGAEAGVPFALGDTKWKAEPNARLAYQRLELDGFADGVSDVAAVDANGVRARAGIQFFRMPDRWLGMEDASPYVALGVQHDFRDAAAVNVGGTVLRDDIPDTTADVSVGFTGTARPNVELHLDLRYQDATEGTRDGLRANFGFRMRF